MSKKKAVKRRPGFPMPFHNNLNINYLIKSHEKQPSKLMPLILCCPMHWNTMTQGEFSAKWNIESG